ncbi:TetR/AcrR family transcriptional regulator [Actinomadura rupiterrae]|uniref:TetR/AcrR family transcriptional regulator n=1 Tax=Actinomadura rupiterrae TaxID=559627 RepID=UPI0020A549B0|nr:TetR/AcrR family transcriptional regulator [Actinomadura rupiterrae]MCP2335558.1 AcrR family transcriptional regulator [Actinomadura rupiterrae]
MTFTGGAPDQDDASDQPRPPAPAARPPSARRAPAPAPGTHPQEGDHTPAGQNRRHAPAPGRHEPSASGEGPPVPRERSGRRDGPVPPRERSTRREKRERTRAALLEAAERLWAEHGIHGASLDDVAAAAGLTKGAVYSNFAGKTDLLLALLEHYTRERIGTGACAELRDTSRPPEERYQRAGLAYRRRLEGEQARLTGLLLVEFWLFGMRDYAAGWRIADWYAECRDNLAGELTDTGGISPRDRATLAIALDAGLAFQHLLDPDRVPADLYGTAMRLILGAD